MQILLEDIADIGCDDNEMESGELDDFTTIQLKNGQVIHVVSPRFIMTLDHDCNNRKYLIIE